MANRSLSKVVCSLALQKIGDWTAARSARRSSPLGFPTREDYNSLYNLRGNGAKDHDRRNESIVEAGRHDRADLEGVQERQHRPRTESRLPIHFCGHD